ncbi:MAG: hypothetical protein RIQ60_4074 [Pseudomonadota bacterium]
MTPDRRALCQALGLLPWIGACSVHRQALRVGAQSFPGYETLYLARALGRFADNEIRLLETPSATASLRALAAGVMDGAALTLDEVLTAVDQGQALVVVSVIDESSGADAVLVKPHVAGLNGLRGRVLAVENSATGAVMLDAALAAGGLSVSDVTIRHASIDVHEQLYKSREVDAVVTYEPVRSRLLARGAREVFDSSKVPGRIIDVLAMRRAVIDTHRDAVRQLVHGQLEACARWLHDSTPYRNAVATRLQVQPDELPQVFRGLNLQDREANHRWLGAGGHKLHESARALSAVMLRAGLLRRDVGLERLLDGRFI